MARSRRHVQRQCGVLQRWGGCPPCARRRVRGAGLRGADRRGQSSVVDTRWDLLQRSSVAVFDFSHYDRRASDPAGPLPKARSAVDAIAQAAAPIAAVAYEVGWALVLGVPMLAVASEGQSLPFDIDIEAVRLAGNVGDVKRVELGLQAALFGVQRGVAGGDLAATTAYPQRQFGGDAGSASLLALAAASSDAMEVRLAAEGILERHAGEGFMLALPAFAPAYPVAERRPRLFHVTAFRPWSKPCEEVVRAACGDTVEYRIGYEQLDPDVLHAIWADIAGASYVVADLTNLNSNAVLELAIAQAIGRPTLVVTQTPNLPSYLPALAKVRVHTYTTDAAGRRVLTTLVRRFLATA